MFLFLKHNCLPLANEHHGFRYSKTPTGKKRNKFMEGDEEEGKKEKKKSGKKKK